MVDDTQEYRKFKEEFGGAVQAVADALSVLANRGDERGLATFGVLMLTTLAAAQTECEQRAWPTNYHASGIG